MVHPLFPGSFDPPTKGHIDLIHRAVRLFGKLTVAVAMNSRKQTTFTVEERVALLSECLAGTEDLRIVSFSGLVVDYCLEHGHEVLIRGLRTISDLEYEYSMALTNRQLAPDVETCFLMPTLDFSFTSSSLVKEIVAGGGDATGFLPAPVLDAMLLKTKKDDS